MHTQCKYCCVYMCAVGLNNDRLQFWSALKHFQLAARLVDADLSILEMRDFEEGVLYSDIISVLPFFAQLVECRCFYD